MTKQSFIKRIVIPIAVVAVPMIGSLYAYEASAMISNRTFKTIILYPAIVIMFISIWMGPIVGNTMAFFRGATLKERFLVSFFTPAIWIIKVYLSFIGIYSFAELVFLLFHPLIVGNLGVNLLIMGISELICRKRYNNRNPEKRYAVFSPSSISITAVGLLITFLGLYNGGHTYYFVYMDVYSFIFL